MAGALDLNSFIYRTAYGPLSIGARGERICRVALGSAPLAGDERPSAATNACANQLMEYFAGKRTVFDVLLLMDGTSFQMQVWECVRQIPSAQTRTATEVAELIGHPGAARAVGAALRQNPLAVLVPAHRVIAANGRVDAADRAAQLRRAFRELEQRFA